MPPNFCYPVAQMASDELEVPIKWKRGDRVIYWIFAGLTWIFLVVFGVLDLLRTPHGFRYYSASWIPLVFLLFARRGQTPCGSGAGLSEDAPFARVGVRWSDL